MLDIKSQCAAQNFRLVTADSEAIIHQLMSEKKRDKVHPTPDTVEEFINHRIGTTSCTRQTWVRLDTDGIVKSALYSARFDKEIIDPTDFCGDVDSILSTPSRFAGHSDPKSIIFYSISSFGKGEGEQTIAQVHEHFNNAGIYKTAPKLSTLSPLRAPAHPKAVPEKTNFVDWLKMRHTDPEILRADKNSLMSEALNYLAQNIHGVQKFHMGNGAEISDINFNANAVGSPDHTHGMGLMVNYGYGTSSVLEANKKSYEQGKLKIASHLRGKVNRDCGHSHQFVV